MSVESLFLMCIKNVHVGQIVPERVHNKSKHEQW